MDLVDVLLNPLLELHPADDVTAHDGHDNAARDVEEGSENIANKYRDLLEDALGLLRGEEAPEEGDSEVMTTRRKNIFAVS
jgi:hypothetical protein